MARGVNRGSRKHVFKRVELGSGTGHGRNLYEMKLYEWGSEMQIKESSMVVCICFRL